MVDISRWLSDNHLLIFVIVACACLHYEFKRVDRRIDAVISLLKRSGIDIYNIPQEYDENF